jgi:Xaa-Pro aminopeptidase
LSEDLLYTFPKEEFEERYRRARDLMRKSNVDGLFVTERSNLCYLSGYRNPAYGIDKLRFWVFILPSKGEPTLVVPFRESALPWLPNVVSYAARKSEIGSYISVIKTTLSNLGLASGNIGCELGREQNMWMNYVDFMKLQNEMPGTHFIDASDILLDLKVTKSELEVDRVRRAAQAAARGAKKTFDNMQPGMTERELEKLLRINIIDEGADTLYRVELFTGLDFTKAHSLEATERKVKRGEQVHFDIQAEYRYYYCDIIRDAFLGYACNESKRLWKLSRRLTKVCLETLKPGIEITKVPKVCLETIESIKRDEPDLGVYFDGLKMALGGIGRMGHSLGSAPAEYPSIALWEKPFIVKPGMILGVSPGIQTPYGSFNLEDNVLVTENGCEILSEPSISDDIPVISA